MSKCERGFTLVESLIALLLLSVGLLGTGLMLLDALRAHADARLAQLATLLVGDMAERIRANPRGLQAYAASGDADDTACVAACDPRQRAAADLAHFAAAARTAFAGAAIHIEFEPAIGPAATDRYAITLEWRTPRVEESRNVVTLYLLAQPVAGEAAA